MLRVFCEAWDSTDRVSVREAVEVAFSCSLTQFRNVFPVFSVN